MQLSFMKCSPIKVTTAAATASSIISPPPNIKTNSIISNKDMKSGSGGDGDGSPHTY